MVVEYTIICDPSKVNRLPTSEYNNNSLQGYPCTADPSGQHIKTELTRKGGNHLLGAELAASCVAVCDYDDDHHPLRAPFRTHNNIYIDCSSVRAILASPSTSSSARISLYPSTIPHTIHRGMGREEGASQSASDIFRPSPRTDRMAANS